MYTPPSPPLYRSDHGLSLQRRSVVPDDGSDYGDGYSSEGRDSYISEGRDGYNSEGRGGYILDGTSICERGKGGSAAATEMPVGGGGRGSPAYTHLEVLGLVAPCQPPFSAPVPPHLLPHTRPRPTTPLPRPFLLVASPHP